VAAVLAVSTAAAVAWALRPVPTAPEMRLEIMTPPTTDPVSMALSPDGRYVVFVARSDSGVSQLRLRALDEISPKPLEGTDGAAFPFWSPDGAVLARREVDRVRVERVGPVRDLRPAVSTGRRRGARIHRRWSAAAVGRRCG
jgi:hypothetical protein